MRIGRFTANRLMRACGTIAIGALVVTISMAVAGRAQAAAVSGTLVGSNGNPLSDREIHFEGSFTHDMFLVQTGAGGAFVIDLPPGAYRLRADRGAVIGSGIEVGDADLALGNVVGSTSNAPQFCNREGVVPGILTTPAPATSNIPAVERTGTATGAAPASSPPGAR
jgi:hypothetical protein